MKNLVNILFLLSCMAISTAFAPQTVETERYCNARFNYCISYPSNTFNKPESSANGDGFQATSKNGELFMSVAGSFNVMDWTLEDIYYFNFEDFKQSETTANNLESVFEDDFSINVFETETQYIFFKTMLMDDKYVTITISAPLSQRDNVEALRDKINLTTKA